MYGRTDDPEIPGVRSVVDYVARRLAIDWLPPADRAELSVPAPGARRALGVTRCPGEQTGDHHLKYLPERSDEVQAHDGQGRIGLVGGEHRR